MMDLITVGGLHWPDTSMVGHPGQQLVLMNSLTTYFSAGTCLVKTPWILLLLLLDIMTRGGMSGGGGVMGVGRSIVVV